MKGAFDISKKGGRISRTSKNFLGQNCPHTSGAIGRDTLH